MLSWFDFTDGDVLLYRGRVRAGGEVLSRPKLFPDAAVIAYATGQAPEQRVYSFEDFKDVGAAPMLLVQP